MTYCQKHGKLNIYPTSPSTTHQDEDVPLQDPGYCIDCKIDMIKDLLRSQGHTTKLKYHCGGIAHESIYQCECGYYCRGIYKSREFNFCPHCGAVIDWDGE